MNVGFIRLVYPLFIIFVLGLFFLLSNSWGYSIYIVDEAANAQCAREMWLNCDFIIPRINGELRPDKPPLHYFFMTIAYSLFGSTPFAARFFSAVFGALTLVITFQACKDFLNEKKAWLCFLILLSSIGFQVQFHLATPDPYLIFFLTASMISFCYYVRSKQIAYLCICYCSIALGFLSKGPIALLFPSLTIFIYFLSKRQYRFFSDIKPLLGMLLFIAIVLPWFYLVHKESNGEWTKGFFIRHNFERFIEPKEKHSALFIFPSLFALALLLPYSTFIVQAVRKSLKNQNILIHVCLLFSTIVILFFSVASTKLPNYLSPVIIFLAIVLSNYLIELNDKEWRKEKIYISAFPILALLLSAIVYISISFETLFFFIESTNIILALLLLTISFILISFFYLNKKVKALIVSFICTSLLLSQFIFYIIFPLGDKFNPVINSIEEIKKHQHIAIYKRSNIAYFFQLPHPVKMIYYPKDLEQYVKKHDDVVIMTRQKFLHTLGKAAPLLKQSFKEKDPLDGTTTIILEKK